MTTYTLFLYHVNSYEVANFTKTQALISIGIAKFCDCLSCRLWRIHIPDIVYKVHDRAAVAPEEEIELSCDDLTLGFRQGLSFPISEYCQYIFFVWLLFFINRRKYL